MRKIAEVPEPNRRDIVRAMLYAVKDGSGTYLFPRYDSFEDGPCTFDCWYETTAEAERHCVEQLGIDSANWTLIGYPRPGCQHDWIAPVALKRDAEGNVLLGKFVPKNDL